MNRNEEEWIEKYEEEGALWIHDGNPSHPHALLTSGQHSSGFFNSRLVTADGHLLRQAASDLLELFSKQGDIDKIEVVIGPQTGATKLAEYISERLCSDTENDMCFWLSPAKDESGGKKAMVFTEEDRGLLPGRYTLLCEDVFTTGGSVGLTATAIENGGGIVLPFILVLVNRSGLINVDGKKIISLIERAMPMWTPDKCPLCKQGSEAIRPKENWMLLNASY